MQNLRIDKTYRSDIDGLRAIAILPVVFFHAGLPGFSGGFVGVDVFFVISGFLITRIIYSEMVDGTFSLARFYERRARRILPALLSVVFVAFVAGSIVLFPSQFEALSESVVASTLFASNIYFWITTDYFRSATEFLPLLHTWSLGVEEQFYVFYPLLLLCLGPTRRKWLLIVLSTGLVASLLLSSYWLAAHPMISFYLLPARAWELAIGCYLAIGKMPSLTGRWLREVVAAVAVLAIAASVTFYSSSTPFPGVAALLPCLGAALIIYTGSQGDTWVRRALSLRAVVWFGLISYSLYLWHWLILALIRASTSRVDIGASLAVAAVLLSILTAALSYRFIESPFRRRDRVSRRQFLGLVSTLMLVTTSIGIGGWLTDGAPFRFDEETLTLVNAATDIDPRRKECFHVAPGNQLCRIGQQNNEPPTFLLWGDSHAAALMPAVSAAAKAAGKTGLFVGTSGCPPILAVWRHDKPGDRTCYEFNDAVIAYLEEAEEPIDLVIMAGRWAMYATGERLFGEAGAPPLMLDDGTKHSSRLENSRVLERALNRSKNALSAMDKQIVFLGGVPEIGWNVPRVLAQQQLGRNLDLQPPTIADFELRNAVVERIVDTFAGDPNFRIVPVVDIICNDDCRLLFEGKPIYSDDDHLSLHGAERLVGPALTERIWADQ
ncbi:MAG: acyltransferase family protein [Woeseiaceae bacterium]